MFYVARIKIKEQSLKNSCYEIFLGSSQLLLYLYRISRNSGRGSYPFVRQILPQNWVSAVLILGAVTINLV